MIEYNVDGKPYSLSYSSLVDKYMDICNYDDETFKANIPEILHTACVIMWLKERAQTAMSDIGIVHELAHFLHLGPSEPTTLLVGQLRKLFEDQCKLVR